jgi:polyketide cyclase/dehydrase/lipid transport protein
VSRLEFSADVVVKCSPQRAFDYFADHRHVAAVLDGVKKWEPIGAKTRGIGARYDVEMEVLGFPIRSVLRLDRWRRPREIGWVSESGVVNQEGRFEFTPTADGVRIVLSIAYVPPASILGAAVAGPLDRVVRSRLQTALEHIREKLEA